MRLSPDPSDADVRAFIAAHPHGATCAEVALVMGLTKQGVQSITASAIAKLYRTHEGRVFLEQWRDHDPYVADEQHSLTEVVETWMRDAKRAV